MRKYSRLVVLVVILVAVVYLVGGHLGKFWHIFLAVMGFSAVVFIHECGHFIAAKLSDIRVETFSIFLPPVLLGVRRTENGLRFRILPKFFPKANDESGDGLLSFTIGRRGKAGETEYRIGLVPLAGYVKMLGQEDTGADKQSDDPRSFSNKSISARMLVIVAGVAFNVIAAIGLLMAVYLIGLKQVPAVVGGVVAESPAARAGLKAGDEIIEIDGKSDNLAFGNIMMAAALSDKGEEVELKIKRDEEIMYFSLVAEQEPGVPLRLFGIEQPITLTIGRVSAAYGLPEGAGLLAGDRIVSINGSEVKSHWYLRQVVRESLLPEVEVIAERTEGPEKGKLIKSGIGLDLTFADSYEIKSESELYHICSMVPRLKIDTVLRWRPSVRDRLVSLLSKIGIGKRAVDAKPDLQKGDIILAIGDVENPTYKEMSDIATEYADQKLSVKVLRAEPNGVEKSLTVTVVPKRPRGSKRALIGIAVVLDAEHPVVAKTIDVEDEPVEPNIPCGAVITAVNGVGVSDFYDVIREIRNNSGKSITIDYRLDDETTGDVVLNVGDAETSVTVKSVFAESISFNVLKRLYKAEGPVDAFVMGCKKSVWFIVKTYVTLKGLFARNVSLKAMSGPVGIATVTYRAVEQSFLTFLYLLAFISANLAVINFLPIPVVDGGVFVLLIVEKIKGKPISIRVQEIITYAGLLLIASAFLYFTYNDILRLLFGW